MKLSGCFVQPLLLYAILVKLSFAQLYLRYFIPCHAEVLKAWNTCFSFRLLSLRLVSTSLHPSRQAQTDDFFCYY